MQEKKGFKGEGVAKSKGCIVLAHASTALS